MTYLIAALLPMIAVAQDAPPAFEVASVKLSVSPRIVTADSAAPKPASASGRYLRYSPEGIDAAAYALRALIVEAYQMESYQGGHSRILTSDSRAEELLRSGYDLIAKAGHAASKEQLRLMLRTLLVDRFKLSMHPETKQEPVYRLVTGKQGPKLVRSEADAENPHWVREQGGMTFHDASLARFCALLSNYLDRPVLDSTGILGFYNFSHLEGASATEDGQSTIFSALKELGLQLVPDKAPLEYMVVDHVEPPSAN